MVIDSRIALGVQQYRAPDPLAAAGNALQLAGMQQQRQLGAMQIAEAQRAAQANQALAEVSRTAGGDIDKLVAALYQRGMPQQAMALQQKALEMKGKQADITKTGLEADEKRAGLTRNTFAFLAADPTGERLYPTLKQMVQNGLLSNPAAATLGEQMLQMPLPERRKYLLSLSQTSGDLAKMLTPNVSMENVGDKLVPVDKNTWTNPNPQALDINMSPAQIQAARDAAAGRAVTMRGQNMTDARGLESNAIARERMQWERDNPSTTAVTTDVGVFAVPNRGSTQAKNVTGPDGKPLAGKLPEAARKEIDSLDAQSAAVQSALESVRGTPSAFSMTRGLATMGGTIPESLAGRADSDAERKARSFVYNNVSKIINERAGAAQSAQELARLNGFLPAPTDNAEQIASKLEAFQEYLKVQRSTLSTPMGQRQDPAATQPPGAPATPAAAKTFDRLPMPRDFKDGQKIRDDQTGQVFEKRGNAWVPVK